MAGNLGRVTASSPRLLQTGDRANGYAPKRSLHLGTTPVQMEIPRTRQGFYPALLPKHQRYLPDAYQQLLQNILLGARSFKAALRTMQALGLSYAPDQLETLLEQIHQEAKTFFSRPLHPDWLFVFADAKIIQLKDEHDQVKKAVHFLIVGVAMNGQKEILTATTFWGNEVLESWRAVLIGAATGPALRPLLCLPLDTPLSCPYSYLHGHRKYPKNTPSPRAANARAAPLRQARLRPGKRLRKTVRRKAFRVLPNRQRLVPR